MKVSRILLMSILTLLFTTTFVQAQDVPAAKTAQYEQPILISSAGQSADVKLVGMLAKRKKLNTKVVSMAKAADLQGMKTLIIVPGFSSKGLGAAGVSQKEELERVTALINKAKTLNIPIILVHIGGNARRKGNSDTFNKLVGESSKQMIVVAQGDKDKFFTNIAKDKKIPLKIVPKIIKAAKPLGELFK